MAVIAVIGWTAGHPCEMCALLLFYRPVFTYLCGMEQPYDVVIVEDDWLQTQLLEDWLADFGHAFRVVGKYETCTTAYLALTGGLRCTLMLLDVELEDMNGMKFFEALPTRPYTIIQTSHAEFAVEAFRVAANDYLVKPFEKERFNQAILRFLAQAQKPSPLVQAIALQSLEAAHILVKVGRDIVRVLIADIIYVRSDQHYLHIVHGDAQTITHMTLAELLPELAGRQFMQIHRSHAINFAYFTRFANGLIYLGPHEIPLGVAYRKPFEEFLEKQVLP